MGDYVTMDKREYEAVIELRDHLLEIVYSFWRDTAHEQKAEIEKLEKELEKQKAIAQTYLGYWEQTKARVQKLEIALNEWRQLAASRVMLIHELRDKIDKFFEESHYNDSY